MKRAAFFVNAEDIQTPSPKGHVGDKFHPFVELLDRGGWSVSIMLSLKLRNKLMARPAFPVRSCLPRHLAQIVAEVIRSLASRLLRKSEGSALPSLRDIHARAQKASYAGILNRLDPDVVFGICLPESLVKVCRDRSIPTVELQHGLAPDNALSYWPHGFIPDSILCWDLGSVGVWRSMGLRAVHTGYPQPLQGDQDCSQTTMLQPRPRVLASLSWGLTESADPFSTVSPELDRAISALARENCLVVLRPHPLEETRFMPKKFDRWANSRYGGGVQISWPSAQSLSQAIVQSDLHLTHNSSTVYEFSLKQKPSFVCDFDFLDAWSALAANDQELIRWVRPFINVKSTLGMMESKLVVSESIDTRLADWKEAVLAFMDEL